MGVVLDVIEKRRGTDEELQKMKGERIRRKRDNKDEGLGDLDEKML